MVERERERERLREGGNSSGNSSRARVKGLFFIAGFNSNEVVSSISRRSLQNPEISVNCGSNQSAFDFCSIIVEISQT